MIERVCLLPQWRSNRGPDVPLFQWLGRQRGTQSQWGSSIETFAASWRSCTVGLKTMAASLSNTREGRYFSWKTIELRAEVSNHGARTGRKTES